MSLRPRIGLFLCLALASVEYAAFSRPASDAYTEGLAVWRKPDKLGRACASCHSADGIELAAYGYDDRTIVRRATPHQGAVAAQIIARYIRELRRRLGIKHLLNPMSDRPMQPGGRALPGPTPEARDKAFCMTLSQILPRLAGRRIETSASARTALNEVLAIDPAQVKVGIVMNRLSEDKFHGNEHASLAHWIPDEAPIAFTADVVRSQDRYLADPNAANLQVLDSLLTRAWSLTLPPSRAIALAKARSLLLLQHRLRTGVLVSKLPPIPDPRQAPTNPFWEVGELARVYTNARAGMLSLPPDVAANKSVGPTLAAQFQDMRVPWMWLGWIADPGLQRTSFDRRTRYADWFSEFLVEDGPYPAHAAFMLTKKLATEAYDKSGWGSTSPQHIDLNFSWLVRNENWRSFAKGDPVYRKALYHFMANSFRMFAMLQSDEVKGTGITYLREPVVQQLMAMRGAAAVMEPEWAKEDAPIFDQAIAAVNGARLAK